MPLVSFLILLLILLVVLWILDRYVFALLPAPWHGVARAIAGIIVVLFLLSAAGLVPPLGALRVGD